MSNYFSFSENTLFLFFKKMKVDLGNSIIATVISFVSFLTLK